MDPLFRQTAIVLATVATLTGSLYVASEGLGSMQTARIKALIEAREAELAKAETSSSAVDELSHAATKALSKVLK